jgi:hypothetical protein
MWNMHYKSRNQSSELQVLKSLNNRMSLSENEKQHLFNLCKGHEGETMFDRLVEGLQCDCLILNDLLLKTNNTLFQIDSLLMLSDIIYLFEIKNYEGDYYYESDRMYKKPNSEIINPLTQLSRTESLLRRLLHNLGYTIPIEASVVFINPEFTLYQSPLNKPFIFPTQINRYLKQLNTIPSKLNEKHKVLADKLVSHHIKDSPFKQLPSYDYDHLRKGITCVACSSFSISVKGNKCICLDCEYEELVLDAVLRSTKEFNLLFPNRKITTNVIHDWCKVVQSKKRISRILEIGLKIVSNNRWSYYEQNEDLFH